MASPMSAMGQKRAFSDTLSNVRFGSKADIQRHPVERPLLGAKRTFKTKALGGLARHLFLLRRHVDQHPTPLHFLVKHLRHLVQLPDVLDLDNMRCLVFK